MIKEVKKNPTVAESVGFFNGECERPQSPYTSKITKLQVFHNETGFEGGNEGPEANRVGREESHRDVR